MAQTKNKEKKKRSSEGIVIQILLAVLSVVIGGTLLFAPGVSTETLCTAFCIVLLAAGACSAAYFFISGGYKLLHDYSLSLGILLMILGCCGLIRNEALAVYFVTFEGIVTLILGTLLLQITVQLTVLKRRTNILAFIFAILALAAAVVTLTGFAPILDAAPVFPQAALMVAGALEIIAFIITAATMRSQRRRDEKQKAAGGETAPAPAPTPETAVTAGAAPDAEDPDEDILD